MINKKTVCITTDYPILKTGLGRNGRCLAEYLYKTGKYNLIYYACGVIWDNPEYQRFPFKMVGALPNNPQEIEQIQKDPQQARDAAYGAYNIDKVIKEFKPHILLMENDSWAFQSWIGKKWWNKIHCIPHITLDSLPFLPDQKKLLESSKKAYVWADFAKKESERLGYNNVEVISGIIDQKDFFKLPKYKKSELRRKNNISEDAFVCGDVFRNQLRKEIPVLLEGYLNFKKQNPELKNTFLLLHSHWSEGAGWDIHRLCENIGVNKEEILTTYICRNCKEYEIKPFTGQDLDCKYCGVKGSPQSGQFTCNVSCGCTEEQLNEVYNTMDCMIHVFNAGGLEIPMVEALYCELPLGTVAYSSGEMFTDQSFVESIDFAWGMQIGTQFKRAVPYASSVAKTLKKFYLMTQQDREKIGKKGREWALSRFSPDVVCKQWEKVIDDLPDHGWDYFFEEEPKNPTAIIPQIQDDSQWIITLYKEILKMTVNSDDPGYKHWAEVMKNGMSRQNIEGYFRQVAAQENQKMGIGATKFEDILDNTGRKRFLIVASQSIGDILYATSLLKSFKKSYPDYDLYLACDSQYAEIFDGNKNLYKIIPYSPIMENEITMTGSGDNKSYFDGYCHLFAGSQRVLNYLTNSNLAVNLK